MNGAPTHFTPEDADLVEQFSTYQRSRAFAEGTIRRRRQTLNLFAGFVAPTPFTAASAGDIDGWISMKRAPRTQHAYRSDLSSFFRWAVRREHLVKNPVLGTDSVRIPRAVPKPAPAEAVNAAFAMSNAGTQLMLLLGALAGLRRGEIAALHSDNVHLDDEPPVIIVREGKGGKDRIVPLHPRLVGMLRGQTGWLFPAPRGGGHIRSETVGRAVERASDRGEQAGYPRFTSHALRHAFGTNMARQSGGDIPLVAALMGHANVSTTMGYVNPYLGAGADVVSRMGAPIGYPPVPEPSEPVVDELAARRLRRTGA